MTDVKRPKHSPAKGNEQELFAIFLNGKPGTKFGLHDSSRQSIGIHVLESKNRGDIDRGGGESARTRFQCWDYSTDVLVCSFAPVLS